MQARKVRSRIGRQRPYPCGLFEVALLPIIVFVLGNCGSSPSATPAMRTEFKAIMGIEDFEQRRESLLAFAESSRNHEQFVHEQLRFSIEEATRAVDDRYLMLQALWLIGSPIADQAALDAARDDPSTSLRYVVAPALSSEYFKIDSARFPIEEYIAVIRDRSKFPSDYPAGLFALGEPAGVVRKAAVGAVARAYGRSEIDFLASMLQDSDSGVRRTALRAIQSCGTPEDLPLVLEHLKELRRERLWEDMLLCFMLRDISGEMPPGADPENPADDELDWWLLELE